MTLNSTLFWAAALALTAGALAFLLPGLMRGEVARRRAAFWVVAAVVPLAAAMLYVAFGTPQAIDATSELGPDLAPTSTSDYLLRLESHLKRQPRDARGWVLLARAHASAERFEEAARAFEQAFSVSPGKVAKDPAVLCEYADVLAMQQGGRLGGRPLQFVMQALELDRRQPMALEMAGSAAYEDGRYADAVRYWSDLLTQLRPGSRRHAELTAAIGRAREKVALPSQ